MASEDADSALRNPATFYYPLGILLLTASEYSPMGSSDAKRQSLLKTMGNRIKRDPSKMIRQTHFLSTAFYQTVIVPPAERFHNLEESSFSMKETNVGYLQIIFSNLDSCRFSIKLFSNIAFVSI